MGYDIVSKAPNAVEAAAFAKRYEYSYLFNKDNEYVGDDNVYFRSNIWGMGVIRNTIVRIAEKTNMPWPMSLLEACSSNSGDEVTPEQIKEFLQNIPMYTGINPDLYDNKQALMNEIREAIKPLVKEVLIARDEQLGPDTVKHTLTSEGMVETVYTMEDRVNDNTNLVVEFIDFCDTCINLEGFEVY